MLKGVNRQVVEVSQPNSQYFERILYIVKPEFSGLSQAKLMNEAGKFNQSYTVPPKIKRSGKSKVAFWLTLIGIVAVAVIAVVMIVLK